MKTLALALAFLSSALFASETEAIARLLYQQMDARAAVREGRSLIFDYPSSTELRAWYVAGLARSVPEEAMMLARDLRFAHPDDPWSWFALAIAQMVSEKEAGDAVTSAQRMLALYKGKDPEVFRLYASVLRDRKMDAELDAFLRDKDEAWAVTERALWLDAKAWRDQTLLDQALSAFADAEAHTPDDSRIWFQHAQALALRRRQPEAIPLFQKAVELSPDALTIRGQYWRALGRDRKEVAAADIAAYLARHGYSPDAMYTAQMAYSLFGDQASSNALRERIVAEFPASREADWVRYSEALDYYREHSVKRDDPEVLAKIVRRWRRYLDYPHHAGESPALRTAYRTLFDLLKTSSSDSEFLAVTDACLAYHDPSDIAASVAEALATRGLRLDEAEKLARIAVRDALVRLERDASLYTKEGYSNAADARRGLALRALGWVLMKRNKLVEAGKHLAQAAKLLPVDATAHHYHGRWYEAAEQTTKAEEAYTAGMAVERAPSTMNLDALRALYVRRHGSDEGWDAYVAAAREGVSSKQKRKVLASRIVPARTVKNPFLLKSLEAKPLSFASLQGKVGVVKFWGVWCGPCVAEMPQFQKFADKYSSDSNVVILTIDTDRDPSIPREFVAKNNYKFDVLLDDGWVSRNSGVRGYPTTWFITPDGKIAFEKQGLSSDLVEEYSWIIDALKAELN